MLKFKILLQILVFSTLSKGDDVFYNINNKKVLHKVSDKFLSISIDPAVLLAGVNLSDVSLTLSKHLSPAYIRLAGPSTQFVKYLDNEEEAVSYHEEGNTFYITPSMWFGINEWFNLASLTPVFGINDRETEKGVWDPKSTLPLLEMSDKFGVTCYWQLGYACSNKTTVQYVEDLNILKQTLNGYPEHNETWKIVGSDFSTCNSDDMASTTSASFKNYIRDLDENVEAVMWQSPLIPKEELGLKKAALWTSIPKDAQPVTFSSAIDWAVKVGEAASLEYDVIFREPRLLEITHDTPVYWFSFLHKKLMGSNVLEIKSINQNPDLTAFAHCTKRQSNFVRSGAVTIMVVNNGTESATANVRLGSIMLEKSMEVQSYILTPSNDSSSEILLNDQVLTMDMLRQTDNFLKPKLRRAKIRTHISLESLPHTISFFVLTGAKYALCTNNEDDLSAILQEINQDQDESLSSEETEFKIEGRLQDADDRMDTKIPKGEKITLQNIKRNILKEMELDKNYYGKMFKKTPNDKNFPEKHIKDDDSHKREMLHKHLRTFIEKSKKKDVQSDAKGKKETSVYYRPPTSNLHLTIQEIEDILKRRAKAKAAAKNIKLSSSELDMLVAKATLKIPKHFISKRDINRILLEEKANYYKNNLFSQEMFEQYGKEKNHFPKFKFRRSINTSPLLNLKSLMEQNKKYMLQRNRHLRQAPVKSFLRTKRDINLDLLRKRTQPNSQFGRSKVIVQPNLKHQKSALWGKGRDKYAPLNLDGQSSEEMFDDFMRFEDLISPKNKYPKLDGLDLDKIDEELFNKPKSKHPNPFLNPRYTMKSSKLPKKKKIAKLDSDEYLQFLKASPEEFGDAENEDEECEDEFGFWVNGPKFNKEKKVIEMLGLKSGKAEKGGNKEHSLFADLGDFNFSDDLDYGYLRKKRETSPMTKEQLLAIKKDIKNEVKKLKQQLKEDEKMYVKEKVTQLIKKKHSHRKNRTNIQYIPKPTTTHSKTKPNNNTINEIITNADSKENTIPEEIAHNKKKRSLTHNDIDRTFGQYKPLTSGLKAWKPSDILNLHTNYFTTLPVYSWVQDQNLKNALVKRKYLTPFGLRKRRFIEESDRNEIFDNDYLKRPKKAEWMHDKDNNNDFEKFERTSDIPNVINKKQVETTTTTSVVDKLVSKEKLTYLERVLGKQKVKPIEDFFQSVKDKFNNMNKSVKDFVKNLL